MSKHVCIQSLPCHCNNSLKITLCFFSDNNLGDIYDYIFPSKEYHMSNLQVRILFFIVELHPGYTTEDRIWKARRFHCHVSRQHVPAVLLRASLLCPRRELLTGSVRRHSTGWAMEGKLNTVKSFQ